MDFEQLAKIENESERVNRTYDIFNEDARLNHTQYLRYHFYICEKPELLGMTNHLLFMGEKK